MFRGTIQHNAPIGAQSWFGCGGSADTVFTPADADDLAEFIAAQKSAYIILGGMANTIIRDGGIRKPVIVLGKNFSQVMPYGESPSCYMRAGAGALNGSVAAAATKSGIGGLEFLSGIPGTLGGALFMNAGAYGTEIKDILIGVEMIGRSGQFMRLPAADLKMSYRHSETPDGSVFVAAILKGRSAPTSDIRAKLDDIKKRRNETQPIREKTGGSTFANPAPDELRRAGLPETTRAWQVVEMVGGRGLQIGGARMSDMHCNFMINAGGASAADLENLGEEIRARALARLGVNLRWEIKIIGDKQ